MKYFGTNVDNVSEFLDFDMISNEYQYVFGNIYISNLFINNSPTSSMYLYSNSAELFNCLLIYLIENNEYNEIINIFAPIIKAVRYNFSMYYVSYKYKDEYISFRNINEFKSRFKLRYQMSSNNIIPIKYLLTILVNKINIKIIEMKNKYNYIEFIYIEYMLLYNEDLFNIQENNNDINLYISVKSIIKFDMNNISNINMSELLIDKSNAKYYISSYI